MSEKTRKDGASMKNSGYKARGRIAQVLADARAEAHLATLKDPSRPYTPASYDSRTSIVIPDRHDISMNKFPINFVKSFKAIEKQTVAKGLMNVPSSSKNNKTIDNGNMNTKVQLLMYDIKDIIINMDTTLSQVSVLPNESWRDMLSYLNDIGPFVDHLIRLLRDSDTKQYEEAITLIDEATSIFLRILSFESIQTNDCQNAMKLSARYLIQLQTPFIQKDPSIESMNALKKGLQLLYEYSMRTDMKMEANDSAYVLELDLILSFLTAIWVKFPYDFAIVQESILNTSSNSAASVDYNEQVNMKRFAQLLEGLLYASGVLRLLSNHEINRKRMIHIGIVESLSNGLHVITSSVYQLQRQQRKSNDLSTQSTSLFDLKEPINDQILNLIPKILIQQTATCRNFSLNEQGRVTLMQSKIISPLCQLLYLFKYNNDLKLNILRVTAKISLFEQFRNQIKQKSSNLKCLCDVIIFEALHADRIISLGKGFSSPLYSNDAKNNNEFSWPSWQSWPILSRVAFTLGNLTTSNNTNRIYIGLECKCLRPLVTLLKAATMIMNTFKETDPSTLSSQLQTIRGETVQSSSDEKDCDVPRDELDDSMSYEHNLSQISSHEWSDSKYQRGDETVQPIDEIVDASIKLLRLLANLSIEENIGRYISSRVEPFQILVDLVPCSLNHEELLLNIVATATNITYYACNEENPSWEELQPVLIVLAVQLSQSLFHPNDELVLEAARALGNLTRVHTVIPALLTRRVDEALLVLLQHSNEEILTVVTGTLVNFTANPAGSDSLILLGASVAVQPLTRLLRKSSLKNLNLSILVCQVLHNLLTVHRPINSKDQQDQSMKRNSVKDEILSPSPVALVLERQREVFIDEIINTQSLLDNLSELIECCQDIVKYNNYSIDKSNDSLESSSKDSFNGTKKVGDCKDELDHEDDTLKSQYLNFIRIGGEVFDILSLQQDLGKIRK